jgi:dTDP-4-amino-4,6-dideoxygalactose transaminase
MGRKLGGRDSECPVTENVSGRLLRLPFFNHLTDAEQGDVIEAVKSLR